MNAPLTAIIVAWRVVFVAQFGRSATINASHVDDQRFRVYSDWRLHNDGFGRVLILSELPPHSR